MNLVWTIELCNTSTWKSQPLLLIESSNIPICLLENLLIWRRMLPSLHQLLPSQSWFSLSPDLHNMGQDRHIRPLNICHSHGEYCQKWQGIIVSPAGDFHFDDSSNVGNSSSKTSLNNASIHLDLYNLQEGQRAEALCQVLDILEICQDEEGAK